MPSHGCGSPVHQDTGKLTRTDCSLSYGYDFGSGSTAWTGQWTSDLTTIVCS
jgi:hypothetical protein